MTTIPLPEFAEQLNNIIPEVMREFSRRQTNELYKGKITVPQFIILSFLEKRGPSKMTDLASYMGVTTAAMTGIVSRLVRLGYVLRVSDPCDRRIIMIRLKASGVRLVKTVNDQRRQMIVDIFRKVSEGDRADYLRILRQILNILKGQR